MPAPRKKDSSMDGSGDAQGQNDISENFFAGGQVAIDGNVWPATIYITYNLQEAFIQ